MAQPSMNSLPAFSSLCGAVPPCCCCCCWEFPGMFYSQEKELNQLILWNSSTTGPGGRCRHSENMFQGTQDMDHSAWCSAQGWIKKCLGSTTRMSSAPHGHSRGALNNSGQLLHHPEQQEVLTIIRKMQSKVVPTPTNSSDSSKNTSLWGTISSLCVFPTRNLPEQNPISTNFQLPLC